MNVVIGKAPFNCGIHLSYMKPIGSSLGDVRVGVGADM